jgi:hypothetical protein
MVYYVQCLNPACHAIGVRPVKATTPGPCRRCGCGMQKIPHDLYDIVLHHLPNTPVEDPRQHNESFLAWRGRRAAFMRV